MISIAHFSDIHLLNDINRHQEYRDIFDKLYIELNNIKPDRIVICGDIVDNKLVISNECEILVGELLNNLAKISKVIVTIGNHDLNIRSLNRIDSVDTIVKLINNPNVIYYNKSNIYDDDNNISWVVYHHPEKNIDPWLNQIKDKTKIYIGLYHEEIYGATNDFGKVFNGNNTKNISYFKNNDYLLLGHLHKRQFFRKNKSAAYCGSILQNNFGESVTNHGFLLWKIRDNKTFEVEEYNIPNDHAFINLYVNESSDYDNLTLEAPIYKDSEIKVHWKDYSSNITTANEKKIRDYINKKFNTIKIKFEKTIIYNDVISSKMLSESLDLTDLQVQTNIFNEYLEEQKYKKEDIVEILKIDEIINSRLQLSKQKTNIEWNIDKFWFDNFKSYGDDNVIDWKDNDGIVQISGFNTDGKTSLIDAITYILYGKTTTTLSPEKFGDSRYINNKRNLDYCIGCAVIDVNGEKFVIQRKTERIWNKNKTVITSCPTTLDFYATEDISEKNKLTGEVRKKTQDKLDLILGDFGSFMRLSMTNSDTLNQILSETRSVFIDNIIRDAGLDIFETKLLEFKEYKKELNEEKLIVDIQESELKIEELKNDIESSKEEIEINKTEIKEFETELKTYNIERDEFNKKLNNVDSSLSNFDESININSIENYKVKISDSNIKDEILNKEIKNLPSQFDIIKLNNLKVKLKETNDKISERKEEISKIKNIITESDNKKDKVLNKIKELKDNEIKNILLKIGDNELKIEIIKNQKENIINIEKTQIVSELQKIELEKNDISNKMKLLQKDGINLKNSNDELDKEIEDYKNSTSCPACGRDYDKNDPKYSEHLAHLQEKIDQLLNKKDENNNKIQKLLDEYKKLKNQLPHLETKESELNLHKENLKEGIFTDDIKIKLNVVGNAKILKLENLKIKTKIDEIKTNIFDNVPTLKENISKGSQLLKNIETIKNENHQIILNIESEIKYFNVEGIKNDIEIEEKLKENFDLRNKKITQKDNLKLTIENFNLKIKELQSEIDKYQEYKFKIEENKNTQLSIDKIDEKIIVIKENIKELTQENSDIEKYIFSKETEIDAISVKIRKYLKQKKKDELYKEYMKCVGRDGLPFYLLKKSIHLINKELNSLLSNLDFTLFFDENLELKMSNNSRLDVSLNAIVCSGKERTFFSLALKIALRQVNIKSKPSIIFLDEITGKLVENSVQEFSDFLENLKEKVKKIVIIEHNHTINHEINIIVKKDENLISSLEIII
jgi:DNA repair exonuclease SbcCD ATPase subunit/predicted MPP superfamily phosphohydrolase